jgi:hypothetical protein
MVISKSQGMTLLYKECRYYYYVFAALGFHRTRIPLPRSGVVHTSTRNHIFVSSDLHSSTRSLPVLLPLSANPSVDGWQVGTSKFLPFQIWDKQASSDTVPPSLELSLR